MGFTTWDVQQATVWADRVYIVGEKINKLLLRGLAGEAAKLAMEALMDAHMAKFHKYPPQARRALNRAAGICEAIGDTLEIMGDDSSAAVWHRKQAECEAKANQFAS
jgi:hypothetical protein